LQQFISIQKLVKQARELSMSDAMLEFTDEPPEVEADLELKIDYNEDGSAARAFEIAAALIRALEDVDSVFAKSIDSSIQTALIVEDLQKSSIKIFLRNLLKAADDDALKTLDWKPLVGQYLVKAKYAALRWLDQDVSSSNVPRITDLTDEIAQLARDSDVRHLPDYPLPNPARLIQSLESLQAIKRRFQPGEGLTITLGKEDYKVKLGTDWSPAELVKDASGPKELVNEQELFLLIHKIDMLGGTQWSFKFGKASIRATIEDADWKEEYTSRRVTLLPGDALHVILRVEQSYSPRGELIDTKHSIKKVLGVIPKEPLNGDLFE
jgi:hypothetical protein